MKESTGARSCGLIGNRKVVRPRGPSSKGSNLIRPISSQFSLLPQTVFFVFGTWLCHILARLHVHTIMIHKPDASFTLFLCLEMKSQLQFINHTYVITWLTHARNTSKLQQENMKRNPSYANRQDAQKCVPGTARGAAFMKTGI